jgi:presenilin-like A22 family membrane protease
MKHNVKITAILLTMFIVSQLIGIYVVNHYLSDQNPLPFGMASPKIENQSDYVSIFPSIITAFVFAILLFFILAKFKIQSVLRLWFFLVVVIALSIFFFSLTSRFDTVIYSIPMIATLIAIPLAIVKIYGRNFIVHNATELLIYPGIASVFVPLLNVWTIVALLIVISVYDAWAVWHSGIMQKMAKYQMTQLKVFSGFFIPYASKKVRQQIANWKKTLSKSKLAKKRIKVSVAILGGGDVVFPIITAGVMMRTLGIWAALLVVLGATLGLAYLFFVAEKKKFYPAMPFITAGILAGILASYLIL